MTARTYGWTLRLLSPLNWILAKLRRNIKHNNSVLHMSYMVHVPYHTVKCLQKLGLKADYLAIGASPTWDKCDFQLLPSPRPYVQALQEFFLFWRVVAKYEIIHSHFAIMLSGSGWELPLLQRMGRKIVIHYRGCEIRDRAKNMVLYPEMNICQQCDYNATVCQENKPRVTLAQQYGDAFLVTTPDMRDFVPAAEHVQFFAPDVDVLESATSCAQRLRRETCKIVHVTNHPGIEGTAQIQSAIQRLKDQGYKIHFVFLSGVTHERVLQEYRDADLAIGKMKMGYYANAQIESMVLGVPTITYVRPEFITDELRNSGFIFSHINDLEQTLVYYLSHPEALEQKRKIARSSILRLHDNERIGKAFIALYSRLKMA